MEAVNYFQEYIEQGTGVYSDISVAQLQQSAFYSLGNGIRWLFSNLPQSEIDMLYLLEDGYHFNVYRSRVPAILSREEIRIHLSERDDCQKAFDCFVNTLCGERMKVHAATFETFSVEARYHLLLYMIHREIPLHGSVLDCVMRNINVDAANFNKMSLLDIAYQKLGISHPLTATFSTWSTSTKRISTQMRSNKIKIWLVGSVEECLHVFVPTKMEHISPITVCGYRGVEIHVLGDGSCLLHSVLRSFNRKYIASHPMERTQMVRWIRNTLADVLAERDGDKTVYENLGGGSFSELGKENPEYTLRGLQRHFRSSAQLGHEAFELISRYLEIDLLVYDVRQAKPYSFGTPNPYMAGRKTAIILYRPGHYNLFGLVTRGETKTLIESERRLVLKWRT